ncbi:MAG: thiamine phosphate synthase [Chloroflexi bacterium]|nr:thiamine phosphate synthase [Chloroflexota bacterium]
MLVTGPHRPGRSLDDIVREAVLGGVDMVQVRDKAASRDDLFATARRLHEITRRHAMLFVNGDAEVAREANADGVHLPADGPSTASARAVVGGGMLISRAVHGREEAVQAMQSGVDMIIAGSVFETPSHPGGPALGLQTLREIASAVDIPVIGIGGIDAENAADVLSTGAAGVAVMSAILPSPDPRAAAARLRDAIDATVRA